MSTAKSTTGQQKVRFRDLGILGYAEAWELQTTLNTAIKEAKKAGKEVVHELLFVEHPPVYTLGKSGREEHLRASDADLAEQKIEFFRINRGGDITYHGPGQVVGYPIFDLDQFRTDAHWYVRSLEEAVIRTLAEFGLRGDRIEEYTGVWLDADTPRPRKICAIGVHLSRWVSMHGFALNVNTNLDHFRNIIPCGIDTSQKPVTSMARELGAPVPADKVKESLKAQFAEVFGYMYL